MKNEWIAISTGLPTVTKTGKFRKHVLATDGKKVFYCVFRYIFKFDDTEEKNTVIGSIFQTYCRNCRNCIDGSILENITHWQHLPKVPKYLKE